jgi:hypothetical protein
MIAKPKKAELRRSCSLRAVFDNFRLVAGLLQGESQIAFGNLPSSSTSNWVLRDSPARRDCPGTTILVQ